MTSRHLHSIALLTSAAFLFCAASLFAQTPSFVSFDAPDAGTGPGQGTVALYINQVGVAAGHYSDSSNLQHGFLRLPNGQITEFDPPNLTGTNPTAINIHGQIVGSGALNHLHFHGFLRNPNGVYAHIDPPGTVVSSPMAINDSGQITGFFQDATDSHGFLRNADGTYVIFDAPGGSNITPLSINNSGVITAITRHRTVPSTTASFATRRATSHRSIILEQPAAVPLPRPLTQAAKSRESTHQPVRGPILFFGTLWVTLLTPTSRESIRLLPSQSTMRV